MSEFETLQDAANANTPEGLDYYWANVDHDVYFNAARLHQYHEVIHYIYHDIYNGVLPGRIAVLDAGCGPGYFLREFGREFPESQLTGVDYALSAIYHAVEIVHDASLIVDNLVKATHPYHEPYDFVFCLQTLEHIVYWQTALRYLISLVKPSGHLIITIPNGEFDKLPQHVNRWTFAEFHEILKPYGDVTMRYLGKGTRILGHVRKGQ